MLPQEDLELFVVPFAQLQGFFLQLLVHPAGGLVPLLELLPLMTVLGCISFMPAAIDSMKDKSIVIAAESSASPAPRCSGAKRH